VTPGARRRTPATAAALALALVLAPSAGAHEHAGAHAAAAAPAPAAVEGLGHARQHARVRAAERAARRRWARLTPSGRAMRLRSAERRTRALNAALAARGRDDTGYWEPALRPLPDYAIHASVLPTGKVLIFGREPLRDDNTRFNLGSARVFDPVTGETRAVPPPAIAENPDANGNAMPAAIYCTGQALLSDGRVLLAGGNLAEPSVTGDEFAGLTRTFLFDPWTETWALGPQMSHGRWYPTLTKLPSGDVLIAGGLDENGHGVINPRMEIYRPDGGVGTVTELPAGARGPLTDTTLPPDARVDLSLYPQMFVLPNANVVLAGPGKQDSALLDTTIAQDLHAGRGTAWIGVFDIPARHHYGGSPALEPDMSAFDGTWNVVDLGGADSNGQGFHLARSTVERLAAGPGTPQWTTVPALNQKRFYLQAVLLPDGGMAAVGGGLGTENLTSTSPGNFYLGPNPPPELKQVELRRPGEQTWRLGAAQQEWRTYHSVAALLPDGRVMSAGDDRHEGPDPALALPDAVRRDSAELYWPPYLFDGDGCALRPVVRAVAAPSAPAATGGPWATLAYGERFGIFSEHAEPGMQAVLVAPAEVTHGVDMNQRLVPLRIETTVASGGLNVLAPASAAIAPPGYYMLFVVDAAGTPSHARWVRLLAPADAAAARGGATPATVSGAWPDPRGRRCVDPDGTLRSEPDPAGSQQPQPQRGASAARRSSKLALDRATIVRSQRRLDVSARISALATGRVRFELFAAGRRTRLTAPLRAGGRRIRLRRAIPAAQARLGTGILTMSYGGDAGTRPLAVRLRAARNAAALWPARPSYRAGRLRASGTISRRARGVVRVQLQYEHGGTVQTLLRSAKIARGRWQLGSTLPAAARRAIAARNGTLDAYVQFTGDQGRRMRGEMRSYEILGEP